MVEYSTKNKKAWEYNAYEFWLREVGDSAIRAEKIKANPIGELKKYAAIFILLQKYQTY